MYGYFPRIPFGVCFCECFWSKILGSSSNLADAALHVNVCHEEIFKKIYISLTWFFLNRFVGSQANA